MTKTTRFGPTIIRLRTGHLGYDVDHPTGDAVGSNVAIPSNYLNDEGAKAWYPVQGFIVDPGEDLNLTGTVTNDDDNTHDFTNPGNANDGNDSTFADGGVFVAGATQRGLETDLGSAQLVEAVSVRATWSGSPSGPSFLESSSDGTTYVDAPGTDALVAGVWTRTLTTPTSARYWRIRFNHPGGFVGHVKVFTWEITGEALIEGDVEWLPAPQVIDGDDTTYVLVE